MAVVLELGFKWFYRSPEQHEQYRTQKSGNGLDSEDVLSKFTLNCGLQEVLSTTTQKTHAINHIMKYIECLFNSYYRDK